ncbi:site-specific DNA-methyltransferase [Brevundimonas sp.]|uniref:DNA-methyltransferase n=1 Tax=Brevundimonas sp. TaxID=1871086 RepID=UPI00289CE26B|nr:site-specific DNA-methyltransferase [Brevundimonas sp.]
MTKKTTAAVDLRNAAFPFQAYPTDITQHVIDAMTPSIEAEIKRVHEAVEAAKANALKEALKKFNAVEVVNDFPPPVDPKPPVPPKPGKRRSSWDGMSPEQRSAVVKARWVVRQANKAASTSEVGRAIKNSLPLAPSASLPDQTANKNANLNAQPWSVIQGDCLAKMANMADGSVDLIFTSPPYNLGEGGRQFGAMWKNAKLQDGYASYSDDMPYEEYVAWQKRFLLECWRLIPDDGAIFYQHKNRIQKGVLRTPHDLNPSLPIRQVLVWARGNGMCFSHRFLTPSHEVIYVFAKPKFRFRKSHGLKDILNIQPERNNAHPAPFPVELPRQIIAATNAKVILDPFAGSGSTGVAALVEGRRFIGIELDAGYVEKTKARLIASEGRQGLACASSGEPIPASPPRPENPKAVDLRLGDCLAEMATLPDASVDLLAADLPYETTACEWDRRIDLEAFWAETRRVLKPTGTVILNSAGRFTADLIVSNPDWHKQSLVWAKTKKGQFLHADYRHLCEHEDILVFSPAGACLRARTKMTYNPQGVVELAEPRVFNKAKVSAGVFKPITTKARKRTQKRTNYPSSILTFASEGNNLHPTQKPVGLMEYLIATYSNPGDTVLDPTMGSGTTGVAAARLGRKFIGMEKEEKFFEIAWKRVQAQV